MLNMPDVTLVIYNPVRNANESARVLNHCMSIINFGDVVHLAGEAPTIPCKAKLVPVTRTPWRHGQIFQSKQLGQHFTTKWMLHIEMDGFPVNPEKWLDEFYDYDYIGAPWPDGVVGNGGCSLQSRKFRDEIENPKNIYIEGPSDVWFCRTMREHIIGCGLKYAPQDVAIRFSYEMPVPSFPGWTPEQSFGFHGRFPWFNDYLDIARTFGDVT